MKSQNHSRRDVLKFLGAAPILAGAAAHAQAPAPKPNQVVRHNEFTVKDSDEAAAEVLSISGVG